MESCTVPQSVVSSSVNQCWATGGAKVRSGKGCSVSWAEAVRPALL